MSPPDPSSDQNGAPQKYSQWHAGVPGSWSPGFALAVILIAMALGAGADRLLSNPWARPARAQGPETGETSRLFFRNGQHIIIPQGSPLRALLIVANAVSEEVSHTLVLPAVVEADPARTVKVLPPVAGRVVSLKVQLGERVTQGQELAVIDSGDLAQAYSDDEKARTMLTLTKQTLDRQVGLEKSGGAAIKDREQAQSDYAQAQSEFDRAETRLRSLGVSAEQMEKTRLLSLKAPIAGSVTDLEVAPGDFLNDPTATIMTIANLDRIWVTANVPEKDTSFVSTGQAVNVTFPAYPGETFSGKVLFVSDVLDPDTRRTKVRIAFDNPNNNLKPNMFANASFAAPAVSRIVVPTSALVMNNDSTSVFVEVAPWTFERRNVEIDYQEGEGAIIKSGVKPGERVIVKGGVRLND
ncbi:MAG TPA: efflux RND transporter periplasmic adaptor subunit [Xanthobacteraceae bacterium]|nr:efflux RND transporter periplasmic adaptor subunit [Xanthobacteraceae bacterium]